MMVGFKYLVPLPWKIYSVICSTKQCLWTSHVVPPWEAVYLDVNFRKGKTFSLFQASLTLVKRKSDNVFQIFGTPSLADKGGVRDLM